MILAIIKDHYVVARVMAGPGYVYPYPHDLAIQDDIGATHVGDWYQEDEGIFYRPITGTPPDWPTELIPTDGEGADNA